MLRVNKKLNCCKECTTRKLSKSIDAGISIREREAAKMAGTDLNLFGKDVADKYS